MIKVSLFFFGITAFLYSSNVSLQFSGVKTNYINSKGEKKRITIEREIAPECMDIHIENNVFWKDRYASSKVPKTCRATFITSAGKAILPMKLHEKIETYGEVEVLAFIKKMQHDNAMLFVDTRDEEWYEYRTIPGAINIHYVYITKPEVFKEEYKASLAKLGISSAKKSLDFSQAKNILLFCNGAWCGQSPNMIKALLALGYPPEKIKWYRGGLDDWLGLSMTTTRK